MILQGCVAIVTGAGSGIGRAGAEIMAREGATLVVADRDPAAGGETASRIVAAGGKALAIETDVGDDIQLDRLVSRTLTDFDRIDILHSHAGVQIEGPLEKVEPDGMDMSWRINVRAHFTLARLVMPAMRRQGGGSIIVTSSSSGVLIDREMIAYATSKHAAVAMVKQIALDYGKYNIRANALCPGWVDTPFNDAFTRQMGGRDKLLAYIKEKVPIPRFASVEEIAESILFLASDRSAYMTGQAFVVDGGESIA
jgi:NAD(P)-dependent dehydrogenase (short-subunit alcohol dehydrogenase family)